MADTSETPKYCIVGAGASGLATAKTFKQRGIPFDCFERETDIGGLWNAATPTGAVYKTCHMVSSRKYTGFEDFPFSDDYPVYPSHAQAVAYLREYAREFGVMDMIEFGKTVTRITEDERVWQVQLKDEAAPRRYGGVVLANGHHDVPRWPDFPGTFTGEMIHSRTYKGPEQLLGKRVLLIGSGNSGCDIAIDGVHHGAKIIHSMRRGYYFVPKFTFGKPTDNTVNFAERLHLPRWFKQRLYRMVNWLLVGPASRYGLPTPAHEILDTHPTISSEIPGLIAHGRITVKPDVAEFTGRKVRFADGSEVEVDMVICATGYQISLPFIDDSLIFDDKGSVKLHLNTFHPERDDFFVTGLVQANGSIWRLADYQAQLIASYIVAMQQFADKATWFRELKRAGAVKHAGRGSFVASDRHKLEHDYYEYRRALLRLIRKFGPAATTALPYAASDQQQNEKDPNQAGAESRSVHQAA